VNRDSSERWELVFQTPGQKWDTDKIHWKRSDGQSHIYREHRYGTGGQGERAMMMRRRMVRRRTKLLVRM